jgi:hypothetical protein
MSVRLRACLLAAAACAPGFISFPAWADDDTKAELQEMRAEIQMLRKQVGVLTARVAQSDRKAAAKRQTVAAVPQSRTGESVPASAIPSAAQPPSAATQETTVLRSAANAGPPGLAPAPKQGHGFMEHKDGDTLTFYVPHGEITAYGNLDVDIEGATKGIKSLRGPGGSAPVGHLGWQPAISTNLSYVGLRGFETIPGMPFRFVYQLETQIDISATSGIGESNSNQSNAVKGGLTSRNSYIGVSDKDWGCPSDRQDRCALQAIHRAAESVHRHGRRLWRDHGQHRRRQPGGIRHQARSLHLVRVAAVLRLQGQRALFARPEPRQQQRQYRRRRERLHGRQHSGQRRVAAVRLQRRRVQRRRECQPQLYVRRALCGWRL